MGALADVTGGGFSPSLVGLDPVFGDPARETGWQTFTHAFLGELAERVERGHDRRPAREGETSRVILTAALHQLGGRATSN